MSAVQRSNATAGKATGIDSNSRMTEHGHITDQMRTDAIDEALAYYNLGDRCTRKNVFVYGVVRYTKGSIVNVVLARGRRISEEFEWLRSSIEFEWESFETALISVPISFVEIFNIPLFVLDDHELERRKENVQMWNAPFQPHASGPKLERVGGVRI
jgi:hypothetical protein